MAVFSLSLLPRPTPIVRVHETATVNVYPVLFDSDVMNLIHTFDPKTQFNYCLNVLHVANEKNIKLKIGLVLFDYLIECCVYSIGFKSIETCYAFLTYWPINDVVNLLFEKSYTTELMLILVYGQSIHRSGHVRYDLITNPCKLPISFINKAIKISNRNSMMRTSSYYNDKVDINKLKALIYLYNLDYFEFKSSIYWFGSRGKNLIRFIKIINACPEDMQMRIISTLFMKHFDTDIDERFMKSLCKTFFH